MISRASFGIILSIGAVLLFAIWPNILPLQQHLATAQIIPGVVRVPPFGSSPADTTAAEAANMTAAEAPPHAANTTATEADDTTATEADDTTATEAPPHAANTTAAEAQ